MAAQRLRHLGSFLIEVSGTVSDTNIIDDALLQKIFHAFIQCWNGLPDAIQNSIRGRLESQPNGERPPPSQKILRDLEPTLHERDGAALRDTPLPVEELSLEGTSLPVGQPSCSRREEPSAPEESTSRGGEVASPTGEKSVQKAIKDKPEFDVGPEDLEDVKGWTEEPETFFSEQGYTLTQSSGLCGYVSRIQKVENHNKVRIRFALRELHLCRKSWGRYGQKRFIEALGADAEGLSENTLKSWLKEGDTYHQLTVALGKGCLFLELMTRTEAQEAYRTEETEAAPGTATGAKQRSGKKPNGKKPDVKHINEHISDLKERKAKEAAQKFNDVAEKLCSLLEMRQRKARRYKCDKKRKTPSTTSSDDWDEPTPTTTASSPGPRCSFGKRPRSSTAAAKNVLEESPGSHHSVAAQSEQGRQPHASLMPSSTAPNTNEALTGNGTDILPDNELEDQHASRKSSTHNQDLGMSGPATANVQQVQLQLSERFSDQPGSSQLPQTQDPAAQPTQEMDMRTNNASAEKQPPVLGLESDTQRPEMSEGIQDVMSGGEPIGVPGLVPLDPTVEITPEADGTYVRSASATREQITQSILAIHPTATSDNGVSGITPYAPAIPAAGTSSMSPTVDPGLTSKPWSDNADPQSRGSNHEATESPCPIQEQQVEVPNPPLSRGTFDTMAISNLVRDLQPHHSSLGAGMPEIQGPFPEVESDTPRWAPSLPQLQQYSDTTTPRNIPESNAGDPLEDAIAESQPTHDRQTHQRQHDPSVPTISPWRFSVCPATDDTGTLGEGAFFKAVGGERCKSIQDSYLVGAEILTDVHNPSTEGGGNLPEANSGSNDRPQESPNILYNLPFDELWTLDADFLFGGCDEQLGVNFTI